MAFKKLEEAGVVDKGKYELMSVGSCRKGGCSGACAYGVQDVLQFSFIFKHLHLSTQRWQIAEI